MDHITVSELIDSLEDAVKALEAAGEGHSTICQCEECSLRDAVKRELAGLRKRYPHQDQQP